MLCDVLEIGKGVTAVIGSGGKTSLIEQLAQELQSRGTVLICTTTKIVTVSPDADKSACVFVTILPVTAVPDASCAVTP